MIRRRSRDATSSGGWAAAWAGSPWPTCWAARACSPAPSGRRRSRARVPSSTAGCIIAAKVRRVIQLFMNGGVSQMDTFDYKPELDRRHGQPFDPGEPRRGADERAGQPDEEPVPVPAARRVRAVGQQRLSRSWRRCVDDLAFLMALASKTNVHGPASYMMNTRLPDARASRAWGPGSRTAWARSRDNLPTFVVLPDPKGLPYNAKGNFTAGFLPQSHQGTILDAGAPRPIPDLFPPDVGRVPHAATAERDGPGRCSTG